MLRVDSLVKEYPSPAGSLRVLDGISLSLEPGQAVSIMGPSGSGKSTLLSILGGLEAPSSGSVDIDGSDPYSLKEPELARFRNEKIGFVFQDHCLLPQCTVLENVLIPALVSTQSDRSGRARQLLEQVGLGARLDHLPSQLSGGEKQRAAIARALVLDPALVLCDEPTGNLDRKSSANVADLLFDLTRQRKAMLVLVTHSEHLAARAPTRYELADGQLEKRA